MKASVPGAETVLSVPPPLKDNPYQRLLYAHLNSQGFQVNVHDGLSFRGLRWGAGRNRIVHVHWLWLKEGSCARFLRLFRILSLLTWAKWRGWRLVWTVHNLKPHEGDRFLDRRLLRWLARNAHGIVTHTQVTADRVRKTWDPRGIVHTIPHGHYRDHYGPPPTRAAARAALGLSEGPLFLFFGRVLAYKGVDRLVRSFRTLPGSSATLLIAGSPESAAIEAEVRAAADEDPRVILHLGHVPDGDVPTYFAAADWVTLPFRRITTSGSAILALSFDRPLVVPNASELRETLGPRAAVYFDGDALAPALEEALRTDATAAGLAARAVADGLSWDGIAAATASLYREALALSRSRGGR